MQGIECRHSEALMDELPSVYKDRASMDLSGDGTLPVPGTSNELEESP